MIMNSTVSTDSSHISHINIENSVLALLVSIIAKLKMDILWFAIFLTILVLAASQSPDDKFIRTCPSPQDVYDTDICETCFKIKNEINMFKVNCVCILSGKFA